MSKIIEAKAVITAQDKTGAEFDKVAAKIKNVAKAADAFKGMTPLAKTGWGQGFDKELDRLKATAAELQVIQKSWQSFNQNLMSGGPMAASKAINALDQWKRTTLNNLRDVKAATEQTNNSTVGYLKNAAKFALMAGGVGAGAYEIGRGVRAVGRSAAERQREVTRYGLAGLTPDEMRIANARADEVSARFPNVGRTEVLSHIRQLRARLGSFDHAVGSVEDIVRAQTVLKSLGAGENSDADLESLVLGLESQGLGGNPEKFRSYLSAFVKAKSLFPDLRGEDFRQYMQRSAASKYGLSDDYLKNIVPTMLQHEGASNFGVMQASAFAALVGHQKVPKRSLAAMQKFGILRSNGNIIDENEFIANPYDWATKRLQPQLAKHGVTLDEEHRGDVVKAITQMFANRKVGEFFASMLVNQGIVEKDRANLAKAKGVEGAEFAARNDPFIASQALVTQLKDAGTAIIAIKPVVDSLNYLADHAASLTSYFDQSGAGAKAGMLALGGAGAAGGLMAARFGYQWFTGTAALTSSAAQLSAAAAALDAAALKLGGGSIAGTAADAAKTAGGFWPWVAWASRIGGALTLPLLTSSDQPEFMKDAIRKKVEEQTASYRAGHDYTFGSDRSFSYTGSEAGFHPAAARRGLLGMDGTSGFTYQPDQMNYKELSVQLQGSAEVKGEATITVKVEPSSDLLRAVETVKQVVKLGGTLQANGPGSNGRTSPDAQPGRGGIGHM